MRIKIISEGDIRNTRIINADTGEMIENVRVVTWELDVLHGEAVATLKVVGVPVEVEASIEGS